MHTKLFEIRDDGTLIPAIATRVCVEPGRLEAENWLLRRAGYGDEPLVFLARLIGGPSAYDCYDWDNRTMQVAHDYIQNHWSELDSGAVIDVEFIIGETKKPKVTERV